MVMQRTATPFTPVRFRAKPPFFFSIPQAPPELVVTLVARTIFPFARKVTPKRPFFEFGLFP